MAERPRRLTLLADVAERANVSITTASRVLSRSDHPVAEETRRRVLEAAAALDFAPNLSARGLVVRRTHLIGLLVDDIASEHAGAIALGVEELAGENGFSVLIGSTNGDPAKEIDLARRFRSTPVDAILWGCSTSCEGADLDRLHVQFRKFEEAGGIAVRIAWGECVPPDVSLSLDQALALITDHLVGLGHRRIALLSGPERVRGSRALQQRMGAALSRHGLELDSRLVFHAENVSTGGRAVAEALGNRNLPCTAVVAMSDLLAADLIAAFRNNGVEVPEHVSVVGFDDLRWSAHLHPALTTIRVPLKALGAAAVENAIWLLGGGARREPRSLPVELIVRESTARAADALRIVPPASVRRP